MDGCQTDPTQPILLPTFLLPEKFPETMELMIMDGGVPLRSCTRLDTGEYRVGQTDHTTGQGCAR